MCQEPELKCPSCGRNLFKSGVTEVCIGGFAETPITFDRGHEHIDDTHIQNADEIHLECNVCDYVLEEDFQQLLSQYQNLYAELNGVDTNDDGRE